MSEQVDEICWICGTNPATTREHLIKKSDLEAIFSKGKDGGRFYFNDEHRRDKIVQGLGADILKSPVKICENCNSARTQPHDLAWASMSNWFRTNPERLRAGQVVRLNRIFPHDTRRQMLKVHLYFAKLFGGMIREGEQKQGVEKIPIDIRPFSEAIMGNRAHREMFLQFGIGDGAVGRSSLNCQIREDRKFVIAHWVHRLGGVAVNVLFLQEGESWRNLETAWHPKHNFKTFRVVDTRPDLAAMSNAEMN